MFVLRYTVWPLIFAASWVAWQFSFALASWPRPPRMMEARPRDRVRELAQTLYDGLGDGSIVLDPPLARDPLAATRGRGG